jgi:chromosome segregation protein
MRLKRLDIKGFKSFAHETVVHFNEQVIGIVGPNGSGKSNIVDAIRWVLGEQKSRELRLDKMNSVIFNGSKKRKPSPMASVSLTFENTKNLLPTEYHQVTITRILYQSGESEYRLNDVPCRLKDISNLFMDTGIGSNSYAIIALGMVDDMLADKENARRSMLEQAAGVSKFKARKHETQQKLEHTAGDLDRVEDLLFEISGNMTTLEKQAKRTEKYFELKEEYKKTSMHLAILKTSEFKNRYKQLEDSIKQEEDALRSLNVQSNAFEAESEQLRSAHLVSEQTLSDKQRELNQLVGKLRGSENELQLTRQQLAFAKQNADRADQTIERSNTTSERMLGEVQAFENSLAEEQKIETSISEQWKATSAELQNVRSSHSNLQSDLDQFLKQSQDIERKLFDLEKQKAVNKIQEDTAHNEIAGQSDQMIQRNQDLEALNIQTTALEAQVLKLTDELTHAENLEKDRISNLQVLEQQVELLTKALADKNRSADAKKNELKLTRSMVESLEGFPESIRFLSNPKNWAKPAPLLSDLIYCQPQYRAAIEYYLEPWLNYYVVDTRVEALEAIKLLRNAQKGKANFFVLEDIYDQDQPFKLIAQAESATSLIEVDAKLQNLIKRLIGQVYVVPDEWSEQAISEHPDTIFISASGGFIRRPASMSGGSVGLFEGKKIGRKKNIEILEKEVNELDAEISQLQLQHQALRKQVQQLREQDASPLMRKLRHDLQLQQQNQVAATTRLENFNTRQAEIVNRSNQARELIEKLQTEFVVIEQTIDVERQNLATFKEQMSGADSSYRAIADELAVLNQKYNELNVKNIQQQNKVQTLARERDYRVKQRSQLAEENEQAIKGRDIYQAEMSKLDLTIAQLEADIALRYEQRKDFEKNLGQAEQVYYGGRNRLTELDDQTRRTHRILTDRQSALNKTKEDFTALRLDMNSIAERLKVEFSLELEEILNQPIPEGLSRPELQVQVEKYKHRLDTYGEINPLAVEAYNEMKGRYDTIDTQRQDVLDAKASLETTIKEIEETATKQFLEAFETIRSNFHYVFRHLFSEDDSCDLILVDPSNPLESPVNIIAKPKGKKPQSISLLSGGEKTLTATALLFALYLYKPAPFCIFDEVDAPLDDVNIEKFNKIIKKFSQDSQFIIVTHNKLTMAAVDVIYGIHMPEPGVSHVTPVDFRTLEHSSEFQTLS